MFGSIYSDHLEFLRQSFRGMNDQYRNVRKESESKLIQFLESLYIKVFGVPEVGFQIRYFHFRKALNLINMNNFANIIDAGSGLGGYTLMLAHRYPHAEVVGIDNSKRNIFIGKTMAKVMSVKNARFIAGTLEKNLSVLKADFIICIDVLEHVEAYQKVLKNFYRTLNHDGYLYIHVPQVQQKRFFQRFKTWSHDGHVREGFSCAYLQKKLHEAGFQKICVWNTFGTIGSLIWELNHLALSRSFILAAVLYPFLLPFIVLDRYVNNQKGLAAGYLYRKI